jgi:acetyltransferase
LQRLRVYHACNKQWRSRIRVGMPTSREWETFGLGFAEPWSLAKQQTGPIDYFMPILNLDKLFYPRSVAVVGASNREGAPGHVVMHNLLHGGFEGPIMPVSAEDRAIAGVLAYPHIDDLPMTPDLAVVCTPPLSSLPELHALGARGTRAAVMLMHEPQFKKSNGVGVLRREAEQFGLRILGPHCLGLMVPGIGLNASVAHVPAQPGGVAFVSQSSTVCAAVLDWARERDIGFSHFLSLGDAADICFGDVIDYLGNDQMTRAILLYVESVQNGRTFMSAGRGASRNKPILVIKSGRTPEGQITAFGKAEADGSDDVYDAAIRRAGMLRVYGFNELFAAVETLARTKPLRGDRLGIISNGRGMAVMAVDSLILNGGRLAGLDDKTIAALDSHVPTDHPRANPVELDADAPPQQYAAVLKALLGDRGVDAVMVLHAPSSAVSSTKVAEAIIQAQKETRGAVLTSWMGGARVAEARHRFANANIPTYDTPNLAVDAFLHMMRYRRNQEMLIETPVSVPEGFAPATEAARVIVDDCLSSGRAFLTGRDAKALLSAYGIATAETRIATTPDDAVSIAAKMGFPVALRLTSRSGPDAVEAPGMEPLLETAADVKSAATRLLASTSSRSSRGGILGITVERMVRPGSAYEVMIRVSDDPVFGPVITFGRGGFTGDILTDRAVALLPLNTSLAREIVSRTRVYRLLQGRSDCPPANIDALCLTLVQVSQMIVDLPTIAALEINPLFVDAQGLFAVNAQILIAPATEATDRRLAIRPYPKELEERFVLPNNRDVLLRPIRPEDEPAHHEFLSNCAPDDLRLRFFHLVRRLPHAEMARLTQIDYDREMAFLATAPKPDGDGFETLGVVRTFTDLHNDKAEYAILVRSDMKGQRLGWKLMDKIIRYSRSRGTKRIVGLVLADNRKMLALVTRLGFVSRRLPDDDVVEVELDLLQTSPAA